MIILSSRAAQQVQTMRAALDSPGKPLRIFVETGGCSGFQYGFSFDDTRTADDVAFERDGVTLIVDTVSLELV